MTKNKGGRPLEYKPDLVDKAQEYLDSCEDKEIEQEKKDGWTTYKIQAKLPTIEGLALYLDVDRTTIYDWCSKFPEFSHIVEKLRVEQADRLINSGLSGDYNPTIAKVLLTKHGYTDKTDITSNGETLNLSFDKTFNKNE